MKSNMKKNYLLLIVSVFLAACQKKDSSVKSIFYNKKIVDMNYDEAKENYDYYKAQNRNDIAAKFLQQMIAISDDHKKNAENKIELIDLYLKDQKYEKAAQVAKDFQNLYPSSPHFIRAAYNEIVATFNMVCTSDRDQTNTIKTTELGKEFLDKFTDDQYNTAVKDMLNICYETLFESESGILDSYIHKYKVLEHEAPLNAAKARLTHIKENIEPHIKNGQARVIDLEIKLAKLENKETLVKEKIQELQNKFPTYIAQNI